MIKELIKDLTFDRINLGQALSRAKLMAFDLNNAEFKSWVNQELSGYANDDDLPNYRKIPCEVFAIVQTSAGTQKIPYDLTEVDFKLGGRIYKQFNKFSISAIEENLKIKGNEQFGYEDFPAPLVATLREMGASSNIIGVRRKMQFAHLEQILNLTKNKLIDTLLELNQAFPNFEDNFQNTIEDQKTAKTIIHNNIYGDHSSTIIGIGDELTQSINSSNTAKYETVYSELDKLGVSRTEISELRAIIDSDKDKNSRGKKVLKWAGKMADKAVETGIELKLPILLEKLEGLM